MPLLRMPSRGRRTSATKPPPRPPLAVIAYWYFRTTGGEMGRPIETCILLSLLAFVICCLVVAARTVAFEPPRRWIAVLFFQASGLLYIGWQVLLVIVSLSKICTNQDGGWVVTKRSSDESTTGEAAPPKRRPSATRTGPSPRGPLEAAFATIPRNEEADAKVPGSLRALSPMPSRPQALGGRTPAWYSLGYASPKEYTRRANGDARALFMA